MTATPLSAAAARLQRALTALVLLAFVGGCSLLDGSPAHQIVLPGSEWSLVAVGGEEVPASYPVALSFDDANFATLETGCQRVAARYVWDSDGAALSFIFVADPTVVCDPESAQQDEFVLNALDSVTRWRVLDRGTIELIGPSVIRLERRATGPG